MKEIVIKIFVSNFKHFEKHIVTNDYMHYDTPDALTEGPRFIYPRLKKIDKQDHIQFLFIYKEHFFYSTNQFDREVQITPITFVGQNIPFRECEFELICKKLARLFRCMVEMILTSEDGSQTAYLYEDNENLTEEHAYLEAFEKDFIPRYMFENHSELYSFYQKYRARTSSINNNIEVFKTLDKIK